MNSKLSLPIICLFIFFLSFGAPLTINSQGLPPELSQGEETNPQVTVPEVMPDAEGIDSNKLQKDLKDYQDLLDSLKTATPQEKIDTLEQFLDDHPDSMYKETIRDMIRKEEALLRIQEEKRMSKEVLDKQMYDDFKSQTKPLTIDQQIGKYEEYLNTHQDSSLLDQVTKDLNLLKQSQGKALLQPQVPGQPQAPLLPITPPGKMKDPSHALFLAAVPGIFVPGLGSFYAGETDTGVLLALVRVGGLGMIVGGVVRESNPLLITGCIAAGASYFIDMLAAPNAARDYNEELEKKQKKAALDVKPFVTLASDYKPYLGLSVNF